MGFFNIPKKVFIDPVKGLIGGGRGGKGDSSNIPRKPLPPAPYTPMGVSMPDMSEYYDVMAKNQQFQNRISAEQLKMAQSQMGIGEEMYTRSKSYRPLEQSVIGEANRGLDPNFYAAKGRNAVIQASAETAKNTAKAMRSRGIDVSSPATVAALKAGSLATGEQAGKMSESEAQRIRDYNLATKAQAIGLGANIPAQSVSGYGQAGQVAGSAGQIAHNAASALAQQYATEQQNQMAYQQLALNQSLAQQQLSLQQAGLQESIRQGQMNIEWQEQQAKAANQQAMWGMLPVVGPLAYGAKQNTFICTELLRQGKISERLYLLALEFDRKLPLETIDGYQCWALGLSQLMAKSRFVSNVISSIAIPYMRYAATTELKQDRPLIGNIVYRIGAPICNVIGRVRRLLGYKQHTLVHC